MVSLCPVKTVEELQTVIMKLPVGWSFKMEVSTCEFSWGPHTARLPLPPFWVYVLRVLDQAVKEIALDS